MTISRTLIKDFSTANKLYVNAVVTFYRVVNGEKTSVLADLYSGISGSAKLKNPQTLDSFGKFKNPIYIESPVVMTITGLGNTPDHDTGIVMPPINYGTGSPEGVVVADIGTLYVDRSGGVGSTLYVKEADSGMSSGWSAK